MSVPQAILVFVVAWLVVVAVGWLVVVPALSRGPARDPVFGALWQAVRVYCGVWHRARFVGSEILPDSDDGHRGLVVVANHTGAVDPLLIQAGCRFMIRWMMAEDMMAPSLDWLWRLYPAIGVARDGTDSAPLREAIRYVKDGGTVGIFPEGRITIPPREIRPFLPGVGLLVNRTKAPVLLVWVSGTPDTNKLGEALSSRSHSRVVYIELVEYEGKHSASDISEDLRRRVAEVSGWPLNDEVLPPGGPAGDAVPSLS